MCDVTCILLLCTYISYNWFTGKHNIYMYNRKELHRVSKHESLDYHTTHNDMLVFRMHITA